MRELLCHPKLPLHLAEEGMLVLEVGQRWTLPEDVPWECMRRKRYGSTEILFLRRKQEEPSEENANHSLKGSTVEPAE